MNGHASDGGRQDRFQSATFARAVAGGMPMDAVLLRVRIDTQSMDMLVRNTSICTFAISTSRFGIGNRAHSNKTPLGLHEVVERLGDGESPGQVFVARRPTARVIPSTQWRGTSTEDFVLSRILRLAGREPGVNRGPGIDSLERCIYIHGTSEEQLLGQPASHGCIRMANADIIDLFNAVRKRPVWCTIEQSGDALPDR